MRGVGVGVQGSGRIAVWTDNGVEDSESDETALVRREMIGTGASSAQGIRQEDSSRRRESFIRGS